MSDAVETTQPPELHKGVVQTIITLSAAAFSFLVWILYFKQDTEPDPNSYAYLPAVNASLNAAAVCCLLCGYASIRKGMIKLHVTFMISTLILSVSFLLSYITYHTLHGDTPYPGVGTIRYVYFTLLISHIVCTMFALPLIMTTFFCAFTRRFELHKKFARITLPLWLYVSVTGIITFFMLRAAM